MLFVHIAKDNKRARLTLGRYPSLPLVRARALAIETRAKIQQGIDPREQASGGNGVMTVADLVEEFISLHAATLRSGKTVARDLRKDVVPIVGSVKLADLHRRGMHRVIDPIKQRGAPVSARRRFDEFRSVVRWGVQRGYLDANPFEALEVPPTSAVRERVLSAEEVEVLWRALPGVFPAPVASALKLSLVTAQRIGEVGGILLSEIDFTKRTWRLPPERTKNGHEHVVPLSTLAMELIEEAMPYGKDDRLFPVQAAMISRLVSERRSDVGLPHWTAHDLRRTACTRMVELGVQPLVVGHIANHRSTTRAGMTLAVYVQYSFTKEKTEAMEVWASALRGIIAGGAEVVPLHGARLKAET